jgi:hypothetical protein
MMLMLPFVDALLVAKQRWVLETDADAKGGKLLPKQPAKQTFETIMHVRNSQRPVQHIEKSSVGHLVVVCRSMLHCSLDTLEKHDRVRAASAVEIDEDLICHEFVR